MGKEIVHSACHKGNEETLQKIFDAIAPLFVPYTKYMDLCINRVERKELWTRKKVRIKGRVRKNLFFAALITQRNYIGFYFMPLSDGEKEDTPYGEVFGELLWSCLKGKSCFHLRDYDEMMIEEVKDALEKGFALYKKRDWI